MTTVLLHGFWGQPADWNPVLERLPLGASVLTPDLHQPGPLAPTTALKDWPRQFWHWMEHELGEEPVQIVGYSMGARLALKAVMHSPKRVIRSLLISGRPYLPESEHAARAEWEQKFARDFQTLEWAELEVKWQEQPVFAHTAPQARRQTSELREILALALTNWSPRLHGFGPELIRTLPETVDWAFGALDQNYLGVAKDLQDMPVRGQINLIPNVGHRVTAEAPDFVSSWITQKASAP